MILFKDRRLTFVGVRSLLKNGYALFILGLLLVYFVYTAFSLVIVLAPENKQSFLTIPSYSGDKLYIRFTHSVEKTAWEEYFTVNDANDMVLTHTKFSSLGWGYPYSATDGLLSITNDDRFQLQMCRPYKEIKLRISKQAMQHIVHGQNSYDLVALFGDGTAVTIKSMYRYEYWLSCILRL